MNNDAKIPINFRTISLIVKTPLGQLNGPGHTKKRSGFHDTNLSGVNGERLKRQIKRLLMKHKCLFSWQIQMYTNLIHINDRTFRRFLGTIMGLGVTELQPEHKRTKPLTKEQKKKRVADSTWILYRLALPSDDPEYLNGNKCGFGDEKKFKMDGPDGIRIGYYLLISPPSRVKRQQGGKGLMVWVMLSISGLKWYIWPRDQYITGESYAATLCKNM